MKAHHSEEFCAPLRLATSLRLRLKGKLFDDVRDDILLLAPCNDIHTFGMNCALDVAFVNKEGVVVSQYRCVTPGQRIRERGAAGVLERMALSDAPWFSVGDQLGLMVQPINVISEEG